MAAALATSLVHSDTKATVEAVAAAVRMADDASNKAWAAEEAAELALAAVKAEAHGGYPKATAAARGAAAMASRSTGQTAARPRSPSERMKGSRSASTPWGLSLLLMRRRTPHKKV